MNPFIKFLTSARSLASQGITKDEILAFAEMQFGKIGTKGLLRKQIDNIFKPKKPVGKKDPDFDNTVEKMQFDDQGKPFNPRDPLKKADGGIMRAGFKDGEGIMQMASDPDIMDERNELSLQLFKKPIDLLTPEEMDLLNDEVERLMQKFSKVDRGAPSITLADGGRAAFKKGLLAKLMPSVEPDGGLFKSIFANKNAPILSGFNTAELFDIVSRISSIPFADGGRAEYKDGPKDPRRRTFMKAAAGIASMLPFGGAKIIGKAAPVVAKVAEISGPALAKIVDTVMSLGKLISVKGKRVKEMVTKKKHEGVEVTEDIQDGSYIIKKGDKEIYYKPGRQDEMGIEDDIIEVIEKTVTKKAGGGVARLLGE